MDIFICWSGPRGKRAAGAISEWLTEVFGPCVKPRASLGIEKGVNWFDGLQESLGASCVGLLCLTPEAIRSPWVNYEAGILSRALGSAANGPKGGGAGRLFTFLWGVSSAELSGPLAAFQSTMANEERDVRQLVESLRVAMPDKDRPGLEWAKGLDQRWPELWKSLKVRLEVIPAATLTEVCPRFEGLFRRKTFEEPTDQCVDQRWLERYVGARETLRAIRESRGLVEHACRGYIVDLYRSLESELDGYSMAISLLVSGPRFTVNDQGSLDILPPGLLAACESRRRRIRQLVARMIDPAEAPFFSEARRFEELEEFAERKNLIHRMTPEALAFADLRPDLTQMWPCDAFCFSLVFSALRTTQRPPPSDRGRDIELRSRWRTSEWDFDRIMYAIFLEQRLRPDPKKEANEASALQEAAIALKAEPSALQEETAALQAEALALAEAELEKTRARQATAAASMNGHGSMMPLHYVLGPLKRFPYGKLDCDTARRIRALVTEVSKLGSVDETFCATISEIKRKLDALSSPRPEQTGPSLPS